MVTKVSCCTIVLFALSFGTSVAQNPADDVLKSLLFPPEILIHHRDEIGLTDEQVEKIRSRLEETGEKARKHEEGLKKALGHLAEALAAESVDEEVALKLLEEVLTMERDLKRLHMRLLIQIRNEMTSEQRKAAARIKRDLRPGEGVEQRLQAKLSRIEKEVQSKAQAGEPPFEVVGLMQKFPELMQNGHVKEAEALLDRVVSMLGIEEEE